MKQENVKNKKENREELVSYIRMGRELSGRQQILLVIQLSLPAIMAQLTSVAMQYIDASMVGGLARGQQQRSVWLHRQHGFLAASAILFRSDLPYRQLS